MNYKHNVRLTLEYNGAVFHGWQKQPNLRTVQSELERIVPVVLRGPISGIQAAGRTDSGVHARGQVVNFKTDAEVNLHTLKHAVSSLLKGDLAVTHADIVPDDFNALRSAKARQYSYWILHREAPAVLNAGAVWHRACRLDIEKMRKAASVLVGRHDFTSFRCTDCNVKNPVKEIHSSEIIVDGQHVIYRVVGKGFLKQMVRVIVGTLVQIGRGTLEVESMEKILEAKDRRAAGMTAPAHGLFLDQVFY